MKRAEKILLIAIDKTHQKLGDKILKVCPSVKWSIKEQSKSSLYVVSQHCDIVAVITSGIARYPILYLSDSATLAKKTSAWARILSTKLEKIG